MREVLDQWDFVLAAYALGVGGTLVTLVWSGLAMIRAEVKREKARDR